MENILQDFILALESYPISFNITKVSIFLDISKF